MIDPDKVLTVIESNGRNLDDFILDLVNDISVFGPDKALTDLLISFEKYDPSGESAKMVAVTSLYRLATEMMRGPVK